MRDLSLEMFFRTRLRQLLELRRTEPTMSSDAALPLVDRCIYSTIVDLRKLGTDVQEVAKESRQ